MRLTSFTDYSLRTMMFLSAQPERRATIAEIAQTFGISENHLVKVVHFLARQGWIDTVRGKGGGMQLAMAPEDINIGRVVRDTEGAALPAECFQANGGDCLIGNCCHLKDVFAEAVRAFYATLDRYTLADIARNRRTLAKVMLIAEV